jgi:hypothetical protein
MKNEVEARNKWMEIFRVHVQQILEGRRGLTAAMRSLMLHLEMGVLIFESIAHDPNVHAQASSASWWQASDAKTQFVGKVYNMLAHGHAWSIQAIPQIPQGACDPLLSKLAGALEMKVIDIPNMATGDQIAAFVEAVQIMIGTSDPGLQNILHDVEIALGLCPDAVGVLKVGIRKKEQKTVKVAMTSVHAKMRVRELGASTRTLMILKGAGIETLGQLMTWSESDLLKLKGFGRRCLKDAKDALAKLNLRLRA